MRFLPYWSRSLVLLVSFMVGRVAAQGTAGTLEATYGTAGVALTAAVGQTLQGTAVEVQADGCVLMAGSVWNGVSAARMVVTRFLPTGQVDTSFGTDGYATYSEGSQPFTARAMAVQADGRIVVAGDSGNTYFVLRLLATGARDTSFTVTSFTHGTTSQLTDVALLPSGRVVISGTTVRQGYSDTDGEIFCLQSSGGRYTTFGSSGQYTFGGTGDQTVTALQVLADGKVLYAGGAGGSAAFAGRLTTGGLEDSTYGTAGGRRTISLGANTQSARAMTLDPNGNLLLAATSTLLGQEMALIRLTPTGALDPFFSEDGMMSVTFGAGSWVPADVLLQSDGRIVLAASQPGAAASSTLRLRRFEWTGAVDASFGTAGDASFTHGSGGNTALGLRTLPGGDLLLGCTTAVTPPLRSLAALRVQRGPASLTPSFTITADPVSQSVPLYGSVTLTVGVDAPPGLPLVYSWYRGTSLMGRTTEPSYRLSSMQPYQEGAYHVQVAGMGVILTSQTAQIRVLNPPVITRPPAANTVVPFDHIGSVSFGYQGRASMQVQLLEGETVISEQTVTNSYDFWLPVRGSSTEDIRTYRMRLINADGEATSEPFRVITAGDPYVAAHADVLVAVGDALSLEVQLFTYYDTRLTWKLNGKTLPVPFGQSFHIRPEARLADAGSYQVLAKNLLGSYTRDLRVSVADLRPRRSIAAQGQRFQLTLPTAGPGLTYEWKKDGQPLLPRAGLSGLEGPTLTFDSPTPADDGAYVCTVRMGTLSLESSDQTLLVADAAPTLAAFTLPPGQIGAPYITELPMPALADHFVIKGLPPGFTYDAVTHTLRGTPAKSGRHPLTFTAVSPLGSSASITTDLVIPTLPESMRGRFFGVLGGAFYNEMDLTISPDGVFSGKITLCSHNGRLARVAFTGALQNGSAVGQSNDNYIGTATLAISGVLPQSGRSELSFLLTPGNDSIDANLRIPFRYEDYESEEALSGYLQRCPYTAKAPLSPAYTGVFNLGFSGASGDGRPGGSGFARVTVTPAGQITQVGKLGDGTAYTAAAPVMHNYTVIGVRHLYGNRGSMTYEYSLQPGSQGPDYLNASISGNFYWIKLATSFSGQANYPIQFSDNVGVEAGSKYLGPNHASGLTGPLMLNANPGDQNVQLYSHNGMSSIGSLGSNHSVVFPKSEERNPLGIKSLKFSPATGLFSGSASIRYEEEVYDYETDTSRIVVTNTPFTFQGIVIRAPNNLGSRGIGFSLQTESFIRNDNDKIIRLKRSYGLEINPQ